MNEKINAFYKYIADRRVAVCGAGISNLAVCNMLAGRCKSLTVYDKRDEQKLDCAAALREKGIELITGEDYLEKLSADVIFRAPGMYYLSPELTAFRKRGIAITSETELFFELCPCRIYAVTGTDGKTTTSTIIAKSLEQSGKRVMLGGNIGIPLLPSLEWLCEDDAAVVELSSFQLISMRRSPDVAAVTNIFPDHLNVHADMDEYINAKRNILLHQNAFSRAVLNADNALCSSLAEDVRGELNLFSIKQRPQRGAFLDPDGYLCTVNGECVLRVLHKDEIKIPGMHNVDNYLTALAVLRGECPPECVAQVARDFSGVEHRIEFVRELRGVRYYNDSIATSPASVTAGLNAFSQRMIIIAGGSDKRLDYTELAQIICQRVKLLILTGDTAQSIESAVRGYAGYSEKDTKILHAEDMEQAVTLASENAVSGDVVSLSPASASFDKYKNFEQRGAHYKQIVKDLK